jgi:hypothetical protein
MNPDWCKVACSARFALRMSAGRPSIKRDPKSGATDFAVFDNLIRDIQGGGTSLQGSVGQRRGRSPGRSALSGAEVLAGFSSGGSGAEN